MELPDDIYAEIEELSEAGNQLCDADIAHHPKDAVSWWNETGRQYGAKSPEVRKWMLDSKNYTLEHYSSNRSAGARLTENYLPPLK